MKLAEGKDSQPRPSALAMLVIQALSRLELAKLFLFPVVLHFCLDHGHIQCCVCVYTNICMTPEFVTSKIPTARLTVSMVIL